MRSMLVDDHVPPSMYRRSLMVTGWYQPGMAHEAMTASGAPAAGAPGTSERNAHAEVVVERRPG